MSHCVAGEMWVAWARCIIDVKDGKVKGMFPQSDLLIKVSRITYCDKEI